VIKYQREYHCLCWSFESVQFQEFLRTVLVERSAALGVPVIAVGVPTVIDGATLCADLLEEAGCPRQALCGRGADLFVTPQDIDQRVTELGRMVGYGITLALQRGLTLEDVTGLLG